MDPWVASVLSVKDVILPPFYIAFIFLIAYFIKNKNEDNNPNFEYFLLGLGFKIFAAIAFCFIYIFYYAGGDTIAYFEGAISLNNIITKDFSSYLSILFGNATPEEMFYTFSKYSPGRIEFYYIIRDTFSFFIVRLISVVALVSFNSYFVTSILLASIAYIGSWKLVNFFYYFYPGLKKQIIISVLFIPSVVFWGSGILKDTFTFAGLCLFVYGIFKVFVEKTNRLPNFILVLLMGLMIMRIKPYIIIALIPGVTLWLSFYSIQKIKNKILRFFVFPSVVVVTIFVTPLFLNIFSDDLGVYSSFDSILQKAQKTQEDLTRENQYGGNYYNIGTFDGTPTGVLKLVPKAIVAGLYRPFIWDARSPVLLISGLENLFLLVFTLLLIYQSGIIKFFQILFSEPIVMFSFVFALVFLMSVGMVTANYGALVRYKIPAIPFFMMSLFIVNYLKKQQRKD